ncbi:MAG: type III pantothenate kinase [Planctomycetota bacterium]|jgi:type III pantothenate kinase
MLEHAGSQGPVLAFDVGNTSVKCARIAAGLIERLFRVETQPAEDLPQRLRGAAGAGEAAALRGMRCVVSSVCPPANHGVAAFWEAAGGAERPAFFGADLAVPIETTVREPQKVGADRLLLALGARHVAGAPCIVVSAGTAITVDLVDGAGRFAGGAIGPGLRMAALSVHEMTSLLPVVDVVRPQNALGSDTEDAIRSGVYWFCAGGVTALVARYRKSGGSEAAPLLCTGSDAPLLLPALAELTPRHEPDLIFRGMEAALSREP